MPKLTPIRGKDLVKILERNGFMRVRQKGSHLRLEHPDGRKTSVPLHSGEAVGKGLLRKILHDVNMTPAQFSRLR
ncbi:MAG: type II toxin-antitoxin system HicA family toxin [Patescibacteria group bacterium]|nr:type II toxin-antitoxin system HicA family toxin [Patescibacteria group bacterium]